MFFEYPYSDMHELNLDWFLAKFKELVEEWNQVQGEWTSLHDYVQNYFDNLNVQTEIDNKINAMILDGTFADIVSPFVTAALPSIVAGQLPDVVAAQISAVVAAQINAVVADQIAPVTAAAAAEWLAANVDPDSGYVIDKSLTISDAAADAGVVGSILSDITERTKQLFNKLDVKVINAYASGGILSAMASARYMIFDIPTTTESTKITVHKGVLTSRFSVNSFSDDKSNVDVGSSYTAGVSDNSASTLTLTCPSGTKSIGIWFASSSDSSSDIESFPLSLMVQYGEEFTGYEYYLAPEGVPELKDESVRLGLTGYVHVTGNNLITNDIQINLGDGWSGNLTDGFTHTAGSEGVLEFVLGSVDNLEPYYVDFDVDNSADVENALLIAQGIESNYTDTYTANTHRVGAFSGLNNNNATLYIKAISSLNVTITNIRCYKVGNVDDPAIQLPYYGNAFNKNSGLINNVTGFWNIAIGENTLKANLMGSRNIALGYAALMKIKYGTRNVGLGTFALSEMIHGDHNVAIGSDSLYRTVNANDNISIGYSTMAKSTSSNIHENVAIGTYAIHEQPDGSNGNVAIGNRAGYRASVDNTFVGNRAGYSSRGQGNVAVGRGALEQVWNNGNYNVIVGYNAGVNAGTEENPNTVSRSIAIGYKAKATKNAQAMIGSDEITEVVFCGNKKINFNVDGTVTWEPLT